MAENQETVPTKKRRRSSLAPRRNKLELTPSIGKDLHKSIDNSLSAEERVEELCKLCVQCAVDSVSRDYDTEDERRNIKDVQGILQECLNKPEMKEAMSAVCNTGNLLPNPENLEMDSMIQEYEIRINRLKKEEDDWNKLFTDLEEKAAQAERLKDKKTVLESELTNEQRSLSENYLPQPFDPNSVDREMCQCFAKLKLLVTKTTISYYVLNEFEIRPDPTMDCGLSLTNLKIFYLRTTQNILMTCCQVREHERNVNSGWKLQENVSEILEKRTTELRSKTFGGLDSPRNLIGHEFPTPPSTPTTGAR